ncbi:Fungal Zn(2)-Cys(6) binuclear cluster domain [Rhizoctonia solani]|uniref:Fungal Zn(2)-Cys(6) binuclear cluster domain n=1 Tax=Rhizoctonia solani TaxID=456999 RepID=A0A8H8SXT8_9AGAM|nr:Fungal Zn(2)-Cys(6) binuclear cluster domain [Rhizoctonia solani]QRW20892.1 Fungal Zn(2)-Cys(6) binuclear cluster domain [Rhizoctonia solani]
MSYSAAGTHVKRPGDDIEALTTCNYLRLFGPNSYNRPAPTPFSYPPQSFTSSALSTSSPSDPTLTYLSSADFEAYLISHLEALVNEDQSQTALHLRWIGNVQSMIHRRLIQGATPQEAEVLHGDWLENCINPELQRLYDTPKRYADISTACILSPEPLVGRI